MGSSCARPPLICLTGPTAAGKTAAAFALFDALPCRLISVDSAQIYRGMDIGTAKPEQQILQRYPHALINIREAWQSYSVAEFFNEASAEIDAAHKAGQLPVLVGGTTMYLEALIDGLHVLPAADANLRAELESEAMQDGWAALHQRLQRLDPVTAAQIQSHDTQRIQRALEVCLLSNQPMSKLLAGARRQPEWRVLPLAITPFQRRQLHADIAERVRAMLDAGLLAEVEELRASPHIKADLSSMRSVGYRQSWAFLDGKMSADELVPAIVAATRQLAKRQLTWLRQRPGLIWVDAQWEDKKSFIIKRIKDFASNP